MVLYAIIIVDDKQLVNDVRFVTCSYNIFNRVNKKRREDILSIILIEVNYLQLIKWDFVNNKK